MCAAAFFRSRGKDVVSRKEFQMTVSMDYRWMTHGEAKELLAAMKSAGILKEENGYLKPCFKVSEVDVPAAYRPPKNILKRKTQTSDDVFPQMVAAAEKVMGRREFVASCNAMQRELGINIVAAGLFILRDAGMDISPFEEKAYSQISKC